MSEALEIVSVEESKMEALEIVSVEESKMEDTVMCCREGSTRSRHTSAGRMPGEGNADSGICVLSEDLVVRILGAVSMKTGGYSHALVCKSWRNLSRQAQQRVLILPRAPPESLREVSQMRHLRVLTIPKEYRHLRGVCDLEPLSPLAHLKRLRVEHDSYLDYDDEDDTDFWESYDGSQRGRGWFRKVCRFIRRTGRAVVTLVTCSRNISVHDDDDDDDEDEDEDDDDEDEDGTDEESGLSSSSEGEALEPQVADLEGSTEEEIAASAPFAAEDLAGVEGTENLWSEYSFSRLLNSKVPSQGKGLSGLTGLRELFLELPVFSDALCLENLVDIPGLLDLHIKLGDMMVPPEWSRMLSLQTLHISGTDVHWGPSCLPPNITKFELTANECTSIRHLSELKQLHSCSLSVLCSFPFSVHAIPLWQVKTLRSLELKKAATGLLGGGSGEREATSLGERSTPADGWCRLEELRIEQSYGDTSTRAHMCLAPPLWQVQHLQKLMVQDCRWLRIIDFPFKEMKCLKSFTVTECPLLKKIKGLENCPGQVTILECNHLGDNPFVHEDNEDETEDLGNDFDDDDVRL